MRAEPNAVGSERVSPKPLRCVSRSLPGACPPAPGMSVLRPWPARSLSGRLQELAVLVRGRRMDENAFPPLPGFCRPRTQLDQYFGKYTDRAEDVRPSAAYPLTNSPQGSGGLAAEWR